MEIVQTHKPKRGQCSACGTAPVNHKLFYAGGVMNDFMETFSKAFFGWMKIPSEGRLGDIFISIFVNTLRLAGLTEFSDDSSKVASGRSELIWNEATRRGIKMQQVLFLKKPLEQYRAKINGRWIYFQSIPIPSWLPQNGYEWIDDKFVLSEKLNSAGVCAPKAKTARTLKKALQAFHELKKPVIVKPRQGSRARHTTTNINTESEFIEAFNLGKVIARTLVIEEHVFGYVYRATVVNNKLAGFFLATPPQVTGDGIHTITELIEIKNKNKPNKISDIVVDEDIISFVKRKNYTLESIVPKDELLDLTSKAGRFLGGYTKEMLPEVHPKFHEIFKKASGVTQIPIAGFDLIVKDATKDPDTQTWGIIECNSMPYIDLHYFAFEGEPVDIAKNIWDLWEEKIKK